MSGTLVNAVTGVYIDKLNRNLILAALSGAGKTIDPSDTTQQLSLQVHMLYQEAPESDKSRCVNCKGISLTALDVCPYCGCDEGDPLVSEPPKQAKKPEANMSTEERVEKKKTKKEKANGKENGAAALAVATDLTPSSQLHTERELDAAVTEIITLKSDAAGSYWTLGHAIHRIHSEQLWKLRTETNEKGKVTPRWKTWESFCHHELQMSPKTANRCMDVAGQYSSEQIRAFGHRKLELVLQAPPEDRERILKEKIEQGAGTREVEAEVRKAKAKTGFVRPTRGKRGGKTSEKQGTKASSKNIVVAELVGTQTIKAYKRPVSLKNVDWKEQARAKKLGDEPIGVWTLLNDVVAYISLVTSASGELQFKVQVVREEGE